MFLGKLVRYFGFVCFSAGEFVFVGDVVLRDVDFGVGRFGLSLGFII